MALWEVSRFEKKAAIRLKGTYEDWAGGMLTLPGIECAPLQEKILAENRDYSFNRDVFDAAIVATAMLKDVPLITRDEDISH